MINLVCTIPYLAGFFQICTPAPLATGYVEGEFVVAAPVETARIERLDVRRGDRVAAGQVLGVLEKRDAEIQVASARAALAEARSKLDNLRTGRRPEEIAVMEASLASARAQEEEAKRTLLRQQKLLDSRATTQAKVDDAATAVQVAEAKIREIENNLLVARLPAREAEIAAAHAAVNQAKALVEQADWRLEQRELTVPVSGTVYDIIRHPGEISGPQAPALSILPDGAVKVRVYVPERSLSKLSVGAKLDVNCDGCEDGLTATIKYISPDPEFTPPVIYSLENRQKLVYLVEAVPDKPGDGKRQPLMPGQIIDVDLTDTTSSGDAS